MESVSLRIPVQGIPLTELNDDVLGNRDLVPFKKAARNADWPTTRSGFFSQSDRLKCMTWVEIPVLAALFFSCCLPVYVTRPLNHASA